MKITVCSIFLVLLLAMSSFGQLAEDAEFNETTQKYSLGIEPAVSPFSLIDLSKVRWSNSYSVSFFSGGSTNQTSGLWNTTLFYDFSPKLSLSLNLGVYHNVGSLWGDNVNGSDATFLPGFNLDYHPSDKFRLSIGMQTYSGKANPYYYNPYYSSPSRYYFPR